MGIYVFHQGNNGDPTIGNGQLWYSYLDGSTWHPDKQVLGVGMSCSPSAVALPSPAGAFSVFHQGESNNGQLWYSYFDGTNWQPDTQVKNVGMTGSPSAVVIPGDGIYVFHQGFAQDGNIWYSHFHFSNSTWDPDKQVPNARIGGQGNWAASPSAVALPDGQIAVFYQGLVPSNGFPGTSTGDYQLWWFRGTNGDQNTQVYPSVVSFSPSAVALPAPAGAISVFYNGPEQGEGVGPGLDLFYSYFDGTTWQQLFTRVQNVGNGESPSAVVVPGDGIYVFHQGISPTQGALWYSHFHFSNSTWDPDQQVLNGVLLAMAPSAIVV